MSDVSINKKAPEGAFYESNQKMIIQQLYLL